MRKILEFFFLVFMEIFFVMWVVMVIGRVVELWDLEIIKFIMNVVFFS